MRYYFNNARNCLRIFLRTAGVKELWLPYELCPVVFKAAKAENVRLKFYHIDENFRPVQDFPKTDFILYPNYFGICAPQAQELAAKYPNFIYDAAHSFFSAPLGIATIYSARKFLPVTDGGILATDIEIPQDFQKERDREEFSSDPLNFDYENFLKNELRFNREKEIKLISEKSQQQLSNFDFEEEKHFRQENFERLHEKFGEINELCIPQNVVAPMVYPLKCPDSKIIAEKLLKMGVFLLQYNYLKNIVPIPTSLCNLTTL